MTLDELTQQLAGIYRDGKPYAFIRQAQSVLAQVPCAPELSALVMRALVDLGYGTAARAWVEARGDITDDPAQAAQLRAALADLPDGVVPWSRLRANLDANLAVLRAHRPELFAHLDALDDLLANVQLHQSRFGDWHPAVRTDDVRACWSMPLTTREDEANIKLPERGKVPTPMIAGLRAGQLVDALRERTERLFLTYSHPLYVIEPDERRFAMWLHLADQSAWLTDPRVHLFVGGDALAQCAAMLETNLSLPLPTLYVNLTETPELAAEMQTAVAKVSTERNEAMRQTQERLAVDYADRDAAHWAEHLRPPGPVLAITSRYTTVLQYAARDALSALRRLGYETHLLIEERDCEQLSQAAIAAAIEQHQPAMVLLFDHLRYEHAVIPQNLPVLGWVQDPLPNLMCAKAGASIGPLDLVCGIYKPRCVAEYRYPADRFVTLEMPVSLEVFHDGPVDADARAAYACDVCFVSNASTPIADLHAEALRTYPAGLHRVLELLYAHVRQTLTQRAFPYDAAMEMTRTAISEFGLEMTTDQLRQLASFYTYRLLDWGRRQETLEWVATWARRTGRSLRIYGRGWENHPTLAEFAGGVIEHGEPLRQALASARMALQLIPSGIRHQRTYEILACGTLPLTRYCERDFGRLPIAEYVRRRDTGEQVDGEMLLPGLERIAFESPEHFEALAERYLADEPARQAIVADLRQVVMEHCTFDAAMRKTMTAFQAGLQRSAAGQLAVANV